MQGYALGSLFNGVARIECIVVGCRLQACLIRVGILSHSEIPDVRVGV